MYLSQNVYTISHVMTRNHVLNTAIKKNLISIGFLIHDFIQFNVFNITYSLLLNLKLNSNVKKIKATQENENNES